MRIFCFFVEPASYTLDLARNVHDKKDIDYCFIKSNTEAVSDKISNKVFLDKLSFLCKIKFILSQFYKTDLIIINGYNNYPFIFTFLLNVFSLRKRFIATDSDTQLSIPNNLLKRFVKWFYLSIIFRSKYVLGFAGGNYSHKELFRNYGMSESRIFLMPMMVDNQKYYHDVKSFPEIFTFLFVGRLIETKNVDMLCESFINSFEGKNAKLVIVGGGENLANFEIKYSHQQIEFKGGVFDKRLIQLYHNSSVFVFPSSVEAWGLVVNEAMSASLSVIAHKEVGSVHDLIINRETGFVINNWKELESKMLELYNNSDLTREMSENAVALMKGYWNYSLYESCLNEAIQKLEKWS